MDYTPISTRRVLMAFALTAFVALVPALFLLLQSGPLSGRGDAGGAYRALLLGAGSVVLTAFLIGAFMLTVAIGRRMIWRPSRA